MFFIACSTGIFHVSKNRNVSDDAWQHILSYSKNSVSSYCQFQIYKKEYYLWHIHVCFRSITKISLNWMATSLISGMVDLFWIGTSKSKMYSFNLTIKMKCLTNTRSPLTDITASDDDVMFLAKMQLFPEHVLVRILDIFLPKNFQHLCWCNFMQKIRNNALFFIKLTNAHFGPILECLSPKNFKKCFSSQKTNTSISVFNSHQSSVVFHIGTTPLIYTTTPGWNGLM